MNDLLKIEKHEGKETVNARELHTFLEVQSKFSDWLRNRVEKYGFIENVDFVRVAKTLDTLGGVQTTYDYFLSLNMGKELSMVENNQKGREARLYFIEVENKAREQFQGPALLALAVLEAQKMLEAQSKQILALKPKADFYDQVTSSRDAIDLGIVAKTLGIAGMGRNNLFEFLRDKHILMSNNVPYQAFIDRGYFRVIETKYTKPDGSIHISFKTLVFQSGVDFIRRQILKGQKASEDKEAI